MKAHELKRHEDLAELDVRDEAQLRSMPATQYDILELRLTLADAVRELAERVGEAFKSL